MAKKISQLKASEAIDGSELLEVSQTVGGSLSSRKATIQKIGAYIGSDLSTVATTGQYADLKGKPSLFSGAYADLTGKPNLSQYATSSELFSGAYADLTGKPSLFSGAYSDLTGKPTIPTNNNQLTNGAGYVTTDTDTTYTAGNAINISGSNAIGVVKGAAVADAAADGSDAAVQLNALLASLRSAGIIST